MKGDVGDFKSYGIDNSEATSYDLPISLAFNLIQSIFFFLLFISYEDRDSGKYLYDDGKKYNSYDSSSQSDDIYENIR